MPFILRGKAYPDNSETVEINGRLFFVHVGGWTELHADDDVSTTHGGDVPAWAALPVVDDPDAVVSRNVADVHDTIADDATRAGRYARIDAIRSIAAGEAGSSKKAHEAAEAKAGGLGVPNDLPAARYKKELKAAAQQKLAALGLL